MFFSGPTLRRGVEIGVCGVFLLLCEEPGNAAQDDAVSGKAAPGKAAPGKAASGKAVKLGSVPEEPVASHPKSKPRSCTSLYKEAQEVHHASRLREAKALFAQCAQPVCATPTRQRCMTEYALLAADVPSIVLAATNETGAVRADVQVTMDGETLAAAPEGRAIPVEPGMHEFAFSTADGEFDKQYLLIMQGQRNRIVSVSLHSQAGAVKSPSASTPAKPLSLAPPMPAPEPASLTTPSAPNDTPASKGPAFAADAAVDLAPEPPRDGRRTMSYVIGGVGLAGVGVGSLMFVWASKDNDSLDRCSPNCKPSSVDHVHNLYVAGDVALGLGLVAIGTATYLYLVSGSVEQPMPTQSAHMDVRPTRGGAFASVAGTF
jgi:hypothetical protein